MSKKGSVPSTSAKKAKLSKLFSKVGLNEDGWPANWPEEALYNLKRIHELESINKSLLQQIDGLAERLHADYRAQLDHLSATMMESQNNILAAYMNKGAPNVDRLIASMLEAQMMLRKAYTKSQSGALNDD
jgi:hypothetical protein